MRTILFDDCKPGKLLHLQDPDAPDEAAFQQIVIAALRCAYPKYRCFPFAGTFRHEERQFRPDVALVAADFSHWFIIEVELLAHSFDAHVLPQVRAFRYGEPQSDCVTTLAASLSVAKQQAQTMLQFVPRGVAVLANRLDSSWETALRAHDIQLVAVSHFAGADGRQAFEVEGSLMVPAESLGFGRFSRTDGAIRMPRSTRVGRGQIQMEDSGGSTALWTVREGTDAIWLTKDVGMPDISDGETIQLIKTIDNRIYLRRPGARKITD